MKLRQGQQLTPKGLAEKTGISQSAISRFELGNHNPSLAFLQRTTEGLGKKVYVEF
ncbi:helix-turn-helix domain-containing protein [Haemophilus haemolyticus]|uniref:helix-turn-helix domain-containing protein n=1 Tax=Haemophilus haemolyticus TaxID=726 RepID=UPI003D805645